VLELPDREVTFPAFTAPALRALLGDQPVVVGSLPGMEEADQVVLVRRLLREGVLVPAGRS
jgi:bifunctional lysine-specific demethylase and histidyl-hydroxylase NO66